MEKSEENFLSRKKATKTKNEWKTIFIKFISKNKWNQHTESDNENTFNLL